MKLETGFNCFKDQITLLKILRRVYATKSVCLIVKSLDRLTYGQTKDTKLISIIIRCFGILGKRFG